MGTGISQFSFRFSTELLKKPWRRRPSSRFNYNYIITIFNLLLLRALETTVSHPSADRVKIPRQFAENPQVLSLLLLLWPQQSHSIYQFSSGNTLILITLILQVSFRWVLKLLTVPLIIHNTRQRTGQHHHPPLVCPQSSPSPLMTLIVIIWTAVCRVNQSQ